MLTKRIIPCLDVKDGRVVKGVGFVNLRDAGDPVDVARRYDEVGADELCFLDITASHERRGTLLDMVSRTAGQVFMPLTVGGGIRTLEDVRRLLHAGADKVSVNTAAVRDPEFVTAAARRFGAQCIVVAIDAKRVGAGSGSGHGSGHGDAAAGPARWEIFTHGGRTPTGVDAVDWARRAGERGAGEILLTSMDRDGGRDGYDLPLIRAVAEAVSVPVIASGGAGTLEHLHEALDTGKADAVLAASMFHYDMHSVDEAKTYLAHRGLPIRMVNGRDA